MKPMPVFFLAHGSPMSALEDNAFTQDWHAMHAGTPKPRAIVVFSAHWFVPGTWVTAQQQPPVIHDFYGFPEALYELDYACPGDPALATAICQRLGVGGYLAKPVNDWGLDHGSWVLLRHLYPAADIPVLQISLDTRLPLAEAVRLTALLKPLRDEGVLFIGSGNIVHNIRRWLSWQPGEPIDWAVAFDAAVADAIGHHDIEALADYTRFPHAGEAVPTVEHYLPLLYCMGLVDRDEDMRFSAFAHSDLAAACSRSVRWG